MLIICPKTQQYLDGFQIAENHWGKTTVCSPSSHDMCQGSTKTKQFGKTVHTKSYHCGKATVNMPQPKLPRFVESGVDLYTITGNLSKSNAMNSNINLCKNCTLVFMRPICSSIPNYDSCSFPSENFILADKNGIHTTGTHVSTL